MNRGRLGFRHGMGTVALAALICGLPVIPCIGQVSDRFVSLDRATGDLRVSFQSGGTEHSFRVILPNHVLPQISASIEHREKGYVYGYEISNAAAAQQPIVTWHAIVDPSVAITALDGPPTWGHDPVRPTATEANASTYVSPPGLHLRWAIRQGQFTDASSGSILPGLKQGPFSIISDGRPGFMRAFFASLVIRTSDDPEFQVPREVLDEELRYINNIQMSGVTRVTVGPAFTPSLTSGEIAAALTEQIHQLIDLRQLSAASGFVQDTLRFLTRWSAGETTSKEKFFSQPPATGTEKDVALVVDSNFSNAK